MVFDPLSGNVIATRTSQACGASQPSQPSRAQGQHRSNTTACHTARSDTMATTHPVEPHVLIIGAGITGLLLAQSLRKEGIAFSVHERDPTPTHRGTGWGLALHWALDTFLSLVPQELQGRLPETYVDPLAVSCGNNGRFPFFNLSTGEERYENLSPKRVRLSREKLRRLLMGGLDIQVWIRS